MMRFALVVAAMITGSLAAAALPAAAQDSFQTMLESDVTDVENMLQISGDELKQVDAILQDGVKQRMAVISSLGITYGQKPSFATLLKLQSQMDDIRTEQQTALSKVLTQQQMYSVDQLAQQQQQQFRTVLLGS
jgi:hypothetical protein